MKSFIVFLNENKLAIMGRTYQIHGFFFIISILCTLPSITFQQFLGQIENPILLNCDDSSGNYTSNSQYAANLVKTLLPSLASQAPLHLSTFYNLTVGQGSDQVFGFAQCMSATTMEICRFCTNESVATLLNSCSNTKGAFIRYFNCTLRYSAQPFLSQLDFNPSYLVGPIAQATDGALFIREKGSFMSNLSNEAAVSPARFAMGIANYTDSIKLYGLAQCTRDLSSTDCYACLVQGLTSYDDDYPISLGGNAYYPSCNIRYEIYAFPPMIGWLPPPHAILQTGGTASNDRSDEQGS